MADKVRRGIFFRSSVSRLWACDSSSISMKPIYGGESSPGKNELACDVPTDVGVFLIYFHRSPCVDSIFLPSLGALTNEAPARVHVEPLLSILSLCVIINYALLTLVRAGARPTPAPVSRHFQPQTRRWLRLSVEVTDPRTWLTIKRSCPQCSAGCIDFVVRLV